MLGLPVEEFFASTDSNLTIQQESLGPEGQTRWTLSYWTASGEQFVRDLNCLCSNAGLPLHRRSLLLKSGQIHGCGLPLDPVKFREDQRKERFKIGHVSAWSIYGVQLEGLCLIARDPRGTETPVAYRRCSTAWKLEKYFFNNLDDAAKDLVLAFIISYAYAKRRT